MKEMSARDLIEALNKYAYAGDGQARKVRLEVIEFMETFKERSSVIPGFDEQAQWRTAHDFDFWHEKIKDLEFFPGLWGKETKKD